MDGNYKTPPTPISSLDCPSDKGCCPCPPQPPRHKPLQLKRGTARAFYRINPMLLEGQPAFEIDTNRLKVGDGKHRYLDLAYIGEGDGKSAYEIWLEEGHTGTVEDFLQSLIGPAGKSTYELWLSLGHEGTIADFLKSLEGASAYQVWIAEGHTGTPEDFFEYLRGPKGLSAYEVWRDEYMHDPSLTIEDYIMYLRTYSWAGIIDP